MSNDDFPFDEVEKAEQESQKRLANLSQEEKDQLYLSSMILTLRHYPDIHKQLAFYRKKIENSPSFPLLEKSLEFSGPESPFSLQYPCQIAWEGHLFQSAEHALHFEKAMQFVDRKTAAAIAAAQKEESWRELSKDVKNFYSPGLEDIWTGLIYSINKEKFIQNKTLQEHLLGTKGYTLFEVNPKDYFLKPTKTDQFEPDDPNWHDWILTPNILGEILTYIRIEFSGEY